MVAENPADDHETRGSEDSRPAVAPPRAYDPDWRERIERAKSAREDGRKAREGKPVVFPIDDRRPLS